MKYIIGIDCYDGNNAYCLVMRKDNVSTILLSKSIKDQCDFMDEVMNIQKYFNAEIIEEKMPVHKSVQKFITH